ncbi:hypothetical protein CDAR_393971 [Caerostris darwini]|uniref:Uncharacterized protein n=1 Tax=Caerostris darwini TaxID=1538125 RepID=A0AAV4TRL6_9ARAC|nr:hypothetical protein CDAR_393971 [Caerostris darwini]
MDSLTWHQNNDHSCWKMINSAQRNIIYNSGSGFQMSDAHQIRLNSLNSSDVIITCADECINRGLVLSGTHMLELTDALSLCRTTYSELGIPVRSTNSVY